MLWGKGKLIPKVVAMDKGNLDKGWSEAGFPPAPVIRQTRDKDLHRQRIWLERKDEREGWGD